MLSILINFLWNQWKEGGIIALITCLALWFPWIWTWLCPGQASQRWSLASVWGLEALTRTCCQSFWQPAQMADCCFAPAFTFNIYNHLSWIPHWPSSHLLAALAVNSHSHCSLVISHCSLSWMGKGFSPGGLSGQSCSGSWTHYCGG